MNAESRHRPTAHLATAGDHLSRAAVVLAVLLIGVHVAAAGAADTSLLNVLRNKGVLTQQEFERLQGTSLPPPQRAGLIDMLHRKGILSADEARTLRGAGAAPGATSAPAAVAEQQVLAHRTLAPQFGYDKGFFARTADGNFSLKVNGRVSSNFFFFEPGTVQTDTETIDRARLGVTARFYRYFRLRLENDFAYSSGLRDAFLAFDYAPAFHLQIGQYKVPFSYEELVSKRYIDFVERAAVVDSTINPSRDIGVMAWGRLWRRLLEYQLAVVNGSGQNHSDNNSDKDVIARLVLMPFAAGSMELLRDLSFGGAVTYGLEPEQTQQENGTTVLVGNSIAGQTETGFTFFPAVASQGERLRTDGFAAWRHGPYTLSSEYISTQQSRTNLDGADLPDLDTDGAYVGGTWLLTGETKPFNRRLYPAHPFLSGRSPGWGAWEAALRYEYFKLRHGPDSPTDTFTNNRYDAVVAGVNWYPNEFLRFSLNYFYGHFGQTGSGSPNPDKHSNNAVLGRAQLEF